MLLGHPWISENALKKAVEKKCGDLQILVIDTAGQKTNFILKKIALIRGGNVNLKVIVECKLAVKTQSHTPAQKKQQKKPTVMI